MPVAVTPSASHFRAVLYTLSQQVLRELIRHPNQYQLKSSLPSGSQQQSVNFQTGTYKPQETDERLMSSFINQRSHQNILHRNTY
ncbi:hypothetical protein FGO68_gene7495 [Halteria grandinella]|uniref:Uncharacterized protein n=1 Tax=Halteria grandinella TaxID=5974 RepID=A0A8J8T849_HALGN|nr:hypothetical protein FGO68_gene7495 [Halteria grandinella]